MQTLQCFLIFSQVLFTTPVSLKENPKINEWLTMVETQMRLTLANLLAQSVKDIQEFSSAQIGPQSYLKWVDSYQVRLKNKLMAFVLYHLEALAEDLPFRNRQSPAISVTLHQGTLGKSILIRSTHSSQQFQLSAQQHVTLSLVDS